MKKIIANKKSRYAFIVLISMSINIPFLFKTVIAESVSFESTILPKRIINFDQLDKSSKTMDAASYDIDQDGDIDIVLAIEFGQNILLKNNGEGSFQDIVLFKLTHDSEDIGIADFNGDGNADIVFVSEDDMKNELYFNYGKDVFVDVSKNLPVDGISNAVVVMDVNNDQHVDIIIGNNGPNNILLNKGDGTFIDATNERLKSENNDATQDLELADIDNDGDADILEANEGQNKVYINNGKGIFRDETENRLPIEINESREVITGDIDADGDLDIYYANVQFSMKSMPASKLLINDGNGFFTHAEKKQIPTDTHSNFTAKFIDLDGDNDLDILTGSSVIFGHEVGSLYAYINDGAGIFSLDKLEYLERLKRVGNVFDINEADYDNDDINDIYIARRASEEGNGGQDSLIFLYNR